LEVTTLLLGAFFEHPERVAPRLLVDGHMLMQHLGLSPGPRIGRLLEAIREAQATGQVKTQAAALALADKLNREM
jgi:hypothetical protein